MPRKLPVQKEQNTDCKEKKQQPKGMKENEVEGEIESWWKFPPSSKL